MRANNAVKGILELSCSRQTLAAVLDKTLAIYQNCGGGTHDVQGIDHVEVISHLQVNMGNIRQAHY